LKLIKQEAAMKTTPMIKIDKFTVSGAEVWCSYDNENLEIRDFFIVKAGASLDKAELSKGDVADMFFMMYDNSETEQMIKDDIAETYAYEDFVESHSARRLG
jgi:predicted metal-binding transcription factor (methanogenesis marker protein 9)